MLNIVTTQTKENPVVNTQKAEGLSNKYSLINTQGLIAIAENQGFKVSSIKYPRGKHVATNMHVVRLDLPGYETLAKGEYKPQLIISNSHDGKSSLRIMAGIFRLVCSNGLVAGDSTLNIRLRHVGLVQTEVEEALRIAAQKTYELQANVERFKAKKLNSEEINNYLEGVLKIRGKYSNLNTFELDSLRSKGNIARLNRVVRLADQGNGLWEVFNRAQEKTIKASGLKYQDLDGNYHRLYGVTNLQKNLKLNQELWELTENFAA